MSAPGDLERLAELFDRAADLEGSAREAVLAPLRAAEPEVAARLERLLHRSDRERERAAGRGPLTALDAGLPGARSAADAGPAPSRLGAYRLVERIGSGGMGEVFRAERDDGQYRQTVAVKRLRAGWASAAHRARFRAERQILARLEHPNIARLLDGGVEGPAGEGGVPYLVMEHVEGRNITAYCDQRSLDLEARLRLFQSVCRAVEHAHRNLVVHRDLKPSNILVTDDGVVKLLDFGIAKLLAPDDPSEAPATSTLAPLLTPEYASPEQVRGEPITTATDVYALGLLLHELLAGRRAQSPDAGSLAALERSVCEQEPPRASVALAIGEPGEVAARCRARGGAGVESLSRLQRRLRGDLDTIVAVALHKDPARRYRSAEALAEDVERHLAGLPVRARPDTLRYRGGKFLRRHRLGVAAAAVVVLALAAGMLVALLGLTRALRAERRAVREAAVSERVSSFLVELFRVNDPGESRGASVTARELLDRGSERIGEELAEQPEVQARLLGTMAEAYESLGLYEAAHGLAERRLTLERRRAGPRSAEAGRALIDLADVTRLRGDYRGAHALALEALDIFETGPSPDAASADLARTLGQIGIAAGQLGDVETAAESFERALALREEALGADHPALWSPLNNLAIARWLGGDAEAARALYLRALPMAEVELGPEHPTIGHLSNNLALALRQVGDLDQAIEMHRRALALRERILDPDHPDVAESLNNLGLCLRDRGDAAAARDVLERALAIRERALGAEHDHVAATLVNLGAALLELGDRERARSLLERSLGVFERSVGPDHPSTAHALEALARLERESGNDGAARRLARRVLEIRESRLPGGHPDLARARELVTEGERSAGR
jgi:eukaryotic-like serine/threonine-protein kinase